MAISTFTTAITGGGKIQASNATYATAQAATSGTVSTEESRPGNSIITAVYYVGRGFCTFDLSSIPTSATIVEGANTFIRAVGAGGGAQNADSDSITVVAATPASNTALEANDFDNVGTTQFITAVSLGSWSTSGNNDYQLNATGVAAVQSALGGYVKFAWRTTKDISATQPAGFNWADMVDGTNYLSVEYTVPSGFFAIL